MPFDPKPVPSGGLHAAATERNRDPIRDVLARASFRRAASSSRSRAAPASTPPTSRAPSRALRWQPSDADPLHLATASAPGAPPPARRTSRRRCCSTSRRQPWPIARADAILNINMIHIAPWSATEALFRGAVTRAARGRHPLPLRPVQARRPPHRREQPALRRAPARRGSALGRARSRRRDRPRDVRRASLPPDVVTMPANNLSLVFRRA